MRGLAVPKTRGDKLLNLSSPCALILNPIPHIQQSSRFQHMWLERKLPFCSLVLSI